MAHHESEISDELMQRFREVRDKLNTQLLDSQLGATGRFPDGRLTEKDEGELRFAVTVFKKRVVIDFGKPIQSLGFRPEEARSLADLLLMKAGEAERETV